MQKKIKDFFAHVSDPMELRRQKPSDEEGLSAQLVEGKVRLFWMASIAFWVMTTSIVVMPRVHAWKSLSRTT
jgi:hypothetical protein